MQRKAILINKIYYEQAGSWNYKTDAQKQAKGIRAGGGRAVIKKSTRQGKVKYLVYVS